MNLSRLFMYLIGPFWLVQLAACGTLAATDARQGSTQFGFDDAAPVSDASISAAIRRRLISDPLINASRITVSTNQGVVTLTGRVDDTALQNRVIRLSEQTRGVKRVNAKLDVLHP